MIKGSTRVARIAGIDVFVHWTFLLLLGWIFLMHLPETGVTGALRGVSLVVALFTCVVLHELGHALTARQFNVPTKDITLLPIGGIARMERIPRNPNQELAIAVAGPAVNVAIAVVLYLLVLAGGGPADFKTIASLSGPWLDKLMWFNVAVVVFNMLPAFPMDGGRVLRALLARRMDYLGATQVAAIIGQFMAVLFIAVGFMSNWVLMLIGLFVFVGARGEAEMVKVQDLADGANVADAMLTDFVTLKTDSTIEDATQALLAGSQQDFPVVEQGQVVGMLYRRELLAALASRDGSTDVSSVMSREFPVLQSHAQLELSLDAFQSRHAPTIPVVDLGQLVGLLTAENLAEWISIGSARRIARRTRGLVAGETSQFVEVS